MPILSFQFIIHSVQNLSVQIYEFFFKLNKSVSMPTSLCMEEKQETIFDQFIYFIFSVNDVSYSFAYIGSLTMVDLGNSRLSVEINAYI